MNRTVVVIVGLGLAVGLALVLVVGWAVYSYLSAPPMPAGPTAQSAEATTSTEAAAHADHAAPEVWTCSMHPQIRRPGPGKCPICGMDLIPAETSVNVGPRTYVTTDAAKALMDVRVMPVLRKLVTARVRLVGKVDYDETKLGYITAWVGGRLDRLFVDYTGVPVKKGDHMVLLYSPQLLTAQEELLQAKRAIKDIENSRLDIMKENAQATLVAARERLRLWGLSKEQIAQIEARGTTTDQMQINSPMGGIVIHKNAQQGMYVETGTRIYTIADLSQVWVKLDAYESDLKWIRYGQKVTFTTEAYPGEEFVGRIAFIDPVVDPRTRTVKVRVNVPNADGRLKPEMFIRGVVTAQVAALGRVMDADLAGKWICYMHPEVVKDGPGKCDICGMPLVTTESLGYLPAVSGAQVEPLVIPASAPLITGKRAIVYVQVAGSDAPAFEGRVVTLGPRAGDEYIVEGGLREGELVVVHGNFKIDSALQLQAKPSMMEPERAEAPAPGTATQGRARTYAVPDEFRIQLAQLSAVYVKMSDALAADDFKAAQAGVAPAVQALAAIDMTLLKGDAHMAWMKALGDLKRPLDDMASAADIEALRVDFALLSDALASAVRAFGVPPGTTVYRLHCPMAFNNRGADWLQGDKEVRNPYFGAAMPKCGDVVETIAPARDAAHE